MPPFAVCPNCNYSNARENKPKRKRKPSEYNQFFSSMMKDPMITGKQSEKAKQIAILWKQFKETEAEQNSDERAR